jgi:topoisomerase-4 subunit B
MTSKYSEDSIRTLDWKEHIRKRPGMYIGKLGDGASPDDGIYVLLKEILDNSIDEFMMGFGKKIDITISDKKVIVRDYGRGVPLGKVIDASSKMNTGAKYDSKVFKKTVGLNGVGIKAVNALSENFIIEAFREEKTKKVEFDCGNIVEENEICTTTEKNGTQVSFIPDKEIFGEYHYISEYVEIPVLQ